MARNSHPITFRQYVDNSIDILCEAHNISNKPQKTEKNSTKIKHVRKELGQKSNESYLSAGLSLIWTADIDDHDDIPMFPSSDPYLNHKRSLTGPMQALYTELDNAYSHRRYQAHEIMNNNTFVLCHLNNLITSQPSGRTTEKDLLEKFENSTKDIENIVDELKHTVYVAHCYLDVAINGKKAHDLTTYRYHNFYEVFDKLDDFRKETEALLKNKNVRMTQMPSCSQEMMNNTEQEMNKDEAETKKKLFIGRTKEKTIIQKYLDGKI